MNKQSRDKIEELITDLKTKIDVLTAFSINEREPLKKLTCSELGERHALEMVRGKNIIDLNRAQSALYDAINNLENIICRRGTE